MGAGIVLGWLWIRTRSIWIVSFSHGALNNWGQYAFKYIENESGTLENIFLLAGINIALLLTGIAVYFRMRKRYGLD